MIVFCMKCICCVTDCSTDLFNYSNGRACAHNAKFLLQISFSLKTILNQSVISRFCLLKVLVKKVKTFTFY